MIHMLDSDCYSLIGVSDAHLLLEDSNVSLFEDGYEMDETRLSFAYPLPDGRVIVTTAETVEGANALLFTDQLCLDEYLKHDKLPLSNPIPNFWEKATIDLEGSSDILGIYKSYVRSRFGFPEHEITESVVRDLYDSVSSVFSTDEH